MDSLHTSFNASDRSYLAILKKDIRTLVAQSTLSGQKQAEIDIIVAEMASNLIKHGGGGEILVRLQKEADNELVELISIDNGCGISDVARMMEDGMSTTNTLGNGLGAIKRLSDVFDLYTLKDWGTIVLSRIYKHELPYKAKSASVDIKAIVVAKPGEKVSGDGYSTKQNKESFKVLISDGLGHGPDASNATAECIKAFRLCPDNSPVEIIRFLHQSVKRTRGLVGTVAIYNFKERKWFVCGVGNIMARIQNGLSAKNIISYNGIIGLNIPNTMKDHLLDSEYGQILVMCSDGIKTRWENQKYPAIFKHDLSIYAAALYKDFARKTDDMSIVVIRIN